MQIPRDRLVTNAELLGLMDPSLPICDSVQAWIAQSDTAEALRRFVDHLARRARPRYFFQPSDVPHRIEQLRKDHPSAVQRTIRDADTFIATYGHDVDWRVPGKDKLGKAHTPNTVRLLARQWQAEHIALAYYLSGRAPAYLDFLRAHIGDFIDDYERGLTETGGNDIFERFYAGHRTRNWLMAHELLLGAGGYTREQQLVMTKVFILHAAKLYDQSVKFNWGNHQLVGLTGLFESTLMHPEFPLLRQWNAHALSLILEHQQKEIESDGFQFERASHYFKLDIINYFRVYRLARLNGISLPPVFEERFRSMFDAMVSLAMPNRSLPVLQDAQDTYTSRSRETEARSGVGTAQSANAAELAEPTEETFMSLGASLFKDPVFRYFGSARLPYAFFWQLDAKAGADYAALHAAAPPMQSVGLTGSHYYVMRSGWSPDDLYMVIDGGLAHDKPDHTHGGVLGVMAYGMGRELLPTYRVRYSDPSYPVLKNSLVKNVALVDTLMQGRKWKGNAAQTGFGIWTYLPTPTVQQWASGSAFDYFKAGHSGFDTLGVRYERTILFVKPDYWFVEDDFRTSGEHTYQQIWQGEFEADSIGRRIVKMFPDARFVIQQMESTPYRIEKKTTAGTYASWFSRAGHGDTRFRTLLMPSGAKTPPAVRIIRDSTTTFESYRCTSGDRTDDFIFNTQGVWTSGKISGDARFSLLRSTKGRMRSLLSVDGTVVKAAGFGVNTPEPVSMELIWRKDGAVTLQMLSPVPVHATVKDARGRTQQYHCRPGMPIVLKPIEPGGGT